MGSGGQECPPLTHSMTGKNACPTMGGDACLIPNIINSPQETTMNHTDASVKGRALTAKDISGHDGRRA